MRNGPASFHHLAQRVLNTPVCVTEYKAEIIMAALNQRLGIGNIERVDGTMMGVKEMEAAVSEAYRGARSDKCYHVRSDIAVIPVIGTLVHRYGHLDPYSGMTGYDGIIRKIDAAMEDRDIKGIWLDFDSPGGECSGMMTAARKIAQYVVADEKPIWGYINEMACSAAYCIASVCDAIVAPPEARTGSIGSIIAHADFTRALDDNGITPTMIRSGDRKARGGPMEKLDEETLAHLQDKVDTAALRFAELSGPARGQTAEQLLSLEGADFNAEEAMSLGLIDAVMDEDEAWDRMAQTIKRQ